MDNILYGFIADRNTPILDNIERYCVSENKDELSIIRIVFYFLEEIKTQLDNSFVRVCIEQITNNADERTKRGLSSFSTTEIHVSKGSEEIERSSKEMLKRIEGGKGNITELMYFLINSDKTEWEKLNLLLKMQFKAKNWVYISQITSLYTSEESGIEIEYINHLGDRMPHIYTRLEFIQDIELIDERYNYLIEEKQDKPKVNNSVSRSANKQSVLYETVFRSPWKEHASDFERILEVNGYINAGQWVGESKKKTELAELYYHLKEKGIITQGAESKHLSLLYSKFGLTVGKDNISNGEYCTMRALKKADGMSDTKDQFDRIFKRWVDQHFG